MCVVIGTRNADAVSARAIGALFAGGIEIFGTVSFAFSSAFDAGTEDEEAAEADAGGEGAGTVGMDTEFREGGDGAGIEGADSEWVVSFARGEGGSGAGTDGITIEEGSVGEEEEEGASTVTTEIETEDLLDDFVGASFGEEEAVDSLEVVGDCFASTGASADDSFLGGVDDFGMEGTVGVAEGITMEGGRGAWEEGFGDWEDGVATGITMAGVGGVATGITIEGVVGGVEDFVTEDDWEVEGLARVRVTGGMTIEGLEAVGGEVSEEVESTLVAVFCVEDGEPVGDEICKEGVVVGVNCFVEGCVPDWLGPLLEELEDGAEGCTKKRGSRIEGVVEVGEGAFMEGAFGGGLAGSDTFIRL